MYMCVLEASKVSHHSRSNHTS